MFELYVVELLQQHYPDLTSTLIRPSTLLRAFLFLDGVEVDAVLDRGRSVVIMELKSSRLDLNAKLSRDVNAIRDQLRLKVVENDDGNPKAVRQLARSSAAIARGDLGNGRPEAVYPLLVSEERGMETFDMNAYLAAIFETHCDAATADRVRPLTTISIDELETVLPYVADETISWEDLLESRFDGRAVKALSVGQALYNLKLERSFPTRPNEVLRVQFETLFARSSES